jgi:hypothetical protein
VLRYLSVPPDVPSYAPQYTVKQQKPVAPPKPPRREEPKPAFMTASLTNNFIDGAEPGDLVVPDFHGKSLRQVTEDCLKAGLRLQSIGSGAAVEQMPPAGANVRAGARIQVRFSSRVEGR